MDSIEKINFSYLSVTNNVRLKQKNDEWELWSMNVSASKICNESIHTKIEFNRGKISLTLILPTMFHWNEKTMNKSDEVWRWVHQKYLISRIIKKLYLIKTNNSSYLAVTEDVCLDQQKDECEWCSMKVSASKIFHESNHTNILFIFKN